MSKKRTSVLGAAALVVLALTLVVAGNLWKQSLKVRRVVVHGTVNVDPHQIIQLAEVEKGAPLYEVDLTRVQRNVQSHYFIRRATVERDLTSGITITVEERTPLTVVAGSDLFYLDETGIVLPSTISKAVYDLPVLSGLVVSAPLKPGSTIETSEVQEALTILTVLKTGNRELFHRISEVRLRTGGDIILYSVDGGVPILFGHGKIADKLARLEAFWSGEVAQRGARELQYVDLRYDGQVVARWTTTPIRGS